MQTDSDTLISRTEEALAKPSVQLQQVIKQRTADVLEDKLSDGTVKIWGVVKGDEGSTGVQEVGEFTFSEIYGHSQSAAVSFASEAASIAKNIVDILSLVDDETEYDLKATYLWGRLKNLNRFIGISQSHDELIISLQQLASQAAFTPPSAEKLKALKVFFDKLGLKVRLSEKTLDNFYDELERAGYDLSPVI
jgi:hypothetical protein